MLMEVKKKQKKWVKFRHKVVTVILYIVLAPYIYLKYGIHVDRFREKTKRNYLILLNHQTPFDQFFVGMSFDRPLYYLATEDIFSMGWISSAIRWLIAPIPIKKQTTDIQAVMNCLRVVRDGGSVVIAPEGNRTYSGRTLYMNPAISGLARKMKLPILLYRIEGGYGVEPRWTDATRRGKMRAGVSRVIEPEEYEKLTNEELFELIRTGLYVDEAAVTGLYRSNKRAEYLERAIYVCPECGLAEFESTGNEIRCKKCGMVVTYGEDKTLSCEGQPFRFPFVAQWYDYQEEFINNLMVTDFTKVPLFCDSARFSEVIVYERKKLIKKEAIFSLYGDKIVVDEGTADELWFLFDDLHAVTVLGRNKLNIYCGKRVYQLKGGKRFNALKYVHIFHRYKNILKGDDTVRFLGL
jgi:1-acyl-sn-glycerol-3-phosphate acyltransferase